MREWCSRIPNSCCRASSEVSLASSVSCNSSNCLQSNFWEPGEGEQRYEVRTIPRIRSQPLPLPSGPSSSPILFSRGEDPSVRALHCGQRAGAGRHAACAGCARRLGAPGLRPLLLQVEGASHRLSLCLEWGVSAVFLHFLGLRREMLRTPGGPRRLWPRCRQAGAQPPVKAWLPRAGTTARVLCSSGPGPSLLPRGSLPPFLD